MEPMVNQLTVAHQHLYEKDFNLWVEQTIQLLRAGQLEGLDLEHLVEELEGLTKSDKRELESRLTVLLEHLLKLGYWEQEKAQNQRLWRVTVREQRRQIKKLLRDSPSLKPWLLTVIAECYGDALQDVIDKTGLGPDNLPWDCPVTVDQLLDEAFLLLI